MNFSKYIWTRHLASVWLHHVTDGQQGQESGRGQSGTSSAFSRHLTPQWPFCAPCLHLLCGPIAHSWSMSRHSLAVKGKVLQGITFLVPPVQGVTGQRPLPRHSPHPTPATNEPWELAGAGPGTEDRGPWRQPHAQPSVFSHRAGQSRKRNQLVSLPLSSPGTATSRPLAPSCQRGLTKG